MEAELQVFEGMSHAQYNFDAFAPETKETFGEIARQRRRSAPMGSIGYGQNAKPQKTLHNPLSGA